MGLEDFSSVYIEAEADGDVVVARFAVERLDEEQNIEQLGRALFALIEHHGFCKVAVDLTAVVFLTSFVLGKLITMHRKLQRIDGVLVLFGLQPSVAAVMKRSNLLDYFRVVDSREEALGLLN